VKKAIAISALGMFLLAAPVLAEGAPPNTRAADLARFRAAVANFRAAVAKTKAALGDWRRFHTQTEANLARSDAQRRRPAGFAQMKAHLQTAEQQHTKLTAEVAKIEKSTPDVPATRLDVNTQDLAAMVQKTEQLTKTVSQVSQTMAQTAMMVIRNLMP
jgi:hypothetical protein